MEISLKLDLSYILISCIKLPAALLIRSQQRQTFFANQTPSRHFRRKPRNFEKDAVFFGSKVAKLQNNDWINLNTE